MKPASAVMRSRGGDRKRDARKRLDGVRIRQGQHRRGGEIVRAEDGHRPVRPFLP